MHLIEVKESDKDIIKEIVAIEEEVFGENGGVDEWILKPIVKYGKVFVLKEQDKEKNKEKVVGIIEFMQKFDEKLVFLYGICTSLEARGKGYGKKLLIESEKYLKENKIKYIELTVDPANEGAIRLYKNLGYKVLEEKKNEYGIGIHRFVMKKEII